MTHHVGSPEVHLTSLVVGNELLEDEKTNLFGFGVF